ncbi:MAG TPA: methyltransferase domain-containing protein [Acidimicrobiales bacterium]
MDRAVHTPYEAFTRDHAYQAGIDHLVRFAGIQPTHVVMDLGGGTGATSLAVLERCEPAELIIVEPDETELGAARAALGDRARYVPATAERLHEHIGPASVDHVIVANAIHLFDDLPRAMTNILSVLRPKGTMSVSTAFHRDASGEDEHRLAKATLLRALRQLRSTPKRASTEERPYKEREELSQDSLVDAFRQAGFDDVTTELVPIAITPDFLAAFLQTDIFALAVLPDYDPAVSCPVLGQAVMDAAANDKTGGIYLRNWLFAKATKPGR